MLTGPPPKPDGMRQRRNKKPEISLRDESVLDLMPAAPADLPETLLDFWREFWSSRVALAIEPKTDMPAIVRLFQLYAERAKLVEIYKMGPLDKKTGRLGPICDLLSMCDDKILKLEDRFGLSPISRLRLGLKLDSPARPKAKQQEMPKRTTVDDPRKILRAVK